MVGADAGDRAVLGVDLVPYLVGSAGCKGFGNPQPGPAGQQRTGNVGERRPEPVNKGSPEGQVSQEADGKEEGHQDRVEACVELSRVANHCRFYQC